MRFYKNKDFIFICALAIIAFALLQIPSNFQKSNIDNIHEKATILKVDNQNIYKAGLIKTGSQNLKLIINSGEFENDTIYATNHLIGKLEFDNIYKEKDKILVSLIIDKESIKKVNIIDYYRLNIELWLVIIFITFLLIFAKWTGAKAIISLIISIIIIWKILLPGFLNGTNPIIISLISVICLTFVIIFLIAGFTKKGLVAFLGAVSGVVITCILSIIFGQLFNINGAVKPFSETLLYSGFANLNLTEIFIAGIFIASSGAVMDIAMDISASQKEIIEHNNKITRKKLIFSGFEIGKAVVGTMTTTLFLAYTGGFTTLLMVLMAQGIPVINIINLNYISAEILHTIVGSFGLVLVAPLTAIIGGLIYKNKT